MNVVVGLTRIGAKSVATRVLTVSLLVSASCSTSEPETAAPEPETIAAHPETVVPERETVTPDVAKLVPGTYVAVSESEWSQELQLEADGTAELTNSNWLAGEWENADTYTYSGRWGLEGDKIILQLLESETNPERIPHTEELRYVAELSLEEIGRTESLPGVINLGPTADNSPLWRATMWREDALRALPWP